MVVALNHMWKTSLLMAIRIRNRQAGLMWTHTHLCLDLYPGQDIWLWPWPLEKSHFWAGVHASLPGEHWPPTVVFTLTAPSAAVSMEGMTFVPKRANFTPPLCLDWVGRGLETTSTTTSFGPVINFKSIYLWPSMWFNALTPINTIVMLADSSCCALSKMTDGLGIISKQGLEECVIPHVKHVARNTL